MKYSEGNQNKRQYQRSEAKVSQFLPQQQTLLTGKRTLKTGKVLPASADKKLPPQNITPPKLKLYSLFFSILWSLINSWHDPRLFQKNGNHPNSADYSTKSFRLF